MRTYAKRSARVGGVCSSPEFGGCLLPPRLPCVNSFLSSALFVPTRLEGRESRLPGDTTPAVEVPQESTLPRASNRLPPLPFYPSLTTVHH